jgi:hypothetical protein
MKAARVLQFGPPSVIENDDLPRPEPAAGQLLVRVKAAGVGPWDALVRDSLDFYLNADGNVHVLFQSDGFAQTGGSVIAVEDAAGNWFYNVGNIYQGNSPNDVVPEPSSADTSGQRHPWDRGCYAASLPVNNVDYVLLLWRVRKNLPFLLRVCFGKLDGAQH